MSCGGHFFNPRYYYNNKFGNSSSSDGDDSIDIGGGGGNLSPEDDPFYDNGERPWNKPDYGGFELDLDNMVIEAYFDDNNRPTYSLKQGKWIPLDPSRNEYYYDGENTSAAGYEMSSVKYYMYKAKNPTFKGDSSYNKSDRLNRFYFYKFYGEYMKVGTQNYLIAIDKYSKLVFAFAVPTKWKNMLVRYAPETWGSVELGWEAKYKENTQSSFSVEGIQYFYEYDPVGIVHRDGTIEIYSWCSDSISKNVYAPRVLGDKIDLDREIAREGIVNGRSPYMPIKVAETTKDTITITAKSMHNISARSKDVTWNSGSDSLDVAYLAYGIGGIVYNDVSPSDIELYKDLYADKPSTGTLVSKLQEISVGNSIDINSGKTYELKSIDSQSGYIDLASSIHKYNDRMYFADTAGFPNNGSGTIADREQIKLHLKYDKDRQLFYIESLTNTSSDTTVTYDTEFTLERGQTKELTIRYKWMKGNDPNGEEVEVTYTLQFGSVQQ